MLTLCSKVSIWIDRAVKFGSFLLTPFPPISDATFHISGATKSVYAPEPFDVGRILQADIVSEGQQITLTTAGPIDPGLVLILALNGYSFECFSLIIYMHLVDFEPTTFSTLFLTKGGPHCLFEFEISICLVSFSLNLFKSS